MKRIILTILAVLFVITSVGCININLPPKATEVPTDAPETEAPTQEPVITESPTEEPTEAPTPEPTEAPEVTGFADYSELLAIEEDNVLDLDFDGLDDKVFIERSKADDYDDRYDVKVTLGSNPGKTHTFTVDYCYEFSAWVVDCDPSDKRLEILYTFVQDSDDWTSFALRVDSSGKAIDEFHDYLEIGSELCDEFTSEKGFPIYKTTDILGTHSIKGYNTVTQHMFEKTTEEYLYCSYPEVDVELKKSFEVTILNDDGSLGETVKLKKGAKLYPYSTNNNNYVIVELEDGRKAKIDVEYHSYPYYDDWGCFLNGIEQSKLFDIIYAD